MRLPLLLTRLNLGLVLLATAMHGVMMLLNEIIGPHMQYLPGIGWIYLPAGTRLLCTLLFGAPGALGLLLSSWIACYWYYFPGDLLRATMGALAGAVGPLLAYLVAQRRFGLHVNLVNLTPQALLACAVGCALASSLLHLAWFTVHGDANLLDGFLVMFAGDLSGTMLILYAARALLPRRA